MKYRVGVDVGGTFTDFLLSDQSGNVEIFKTSTTPSDPTVGFFKGLEKAASSKSLTLKEFLGQIELIVHGTTITTNAVLTGDGAKTGFITTKGFRDILNFRRGLKNRQYEKYPQPNPLIQRHLVREVEERISVEGNITTPLNENDVREAARYFKENGVDAIAVSLLWSFLDSVHEKRIEEILQEECPDAYVSISSEVLPQIRVYERNSTTALNAYIGPVLKRYLKKLGGELSDKGFAGTLLIMQSNGGVMTPEVAQRFASNTLLSGPAGAPLAGTFYGGTHGFRNIITVDMGGTSFDISLVKDGVPALTTEGVIDGHRVASPILDIHTVGAGGGSIAWVDAGGLLAVGPKSAGADPGPACYGRGGSSPTVTDAQYVLGYLRPEFFEKGELEFDAQAPSRVIKEKVANPLGLEVIDAAYGIYQLANTNMAAALNVASVQKGYDPREFVLVVAGGAGPIHAAPIARELDIPLILIPRASSVFCAAGMLISDLKHDYVRTCIKDYDRIDIEELNGIYKDLAGQAAQTLREENLSADNISLSYSADVRYLGQFNEVEVSAFAGGEFSQADLDALVEKFHQRHNELYGYSMPGDPIELINLRLSAKGLTVKPSVEKTPCGDADPAAALLGVREAMFDEGECSVHIYDGMKVLPGNVIDGPAIITQPTTTIVVPPDFSLVCDEFNNFLMHKKGREVKELIANLLQ